jgi:hypothetical protein
MSFLTRALAAFAALSLSASVAAPTRWEWLPGHAPSASTPKTVAAALPRSLVDRADEVSGAQVHAMYVVASDGVDEQLDSNGRIATSVAGFNRWLSGQTAGRTLRIDTYQGATDITFRRLARTDADLRSTGALVRFSIEVELRAAGMIRDDKLYAVYYGGSSSVSCGEAPYPPLTPGNVAVVYLRGDGCPTQDMGTSIEAPLYFDFGMLHELIHAQGLVASCAPHINPFGHISDSANDLMWTGNAPWQLPPRLDIGRDDYYLHGIPGCLDLDQSRYLVGGTGGAGTTGTTSYQGLWLSSPLGTEAGWGVNIAHQGQILFATWFTYEARTAPNDMWLVMSNGAQVSPGVFSGTLFRTTGPAFSVLPFASIAFPNNFTTVGTLTFTFSDPDNGVMSYTVNGITQAKPITRYVFAAPAPVCTLGGPAGSSPNYTDLWLHSPVGTEVGWGLNVTHQGNIAFATWFTYEGNGSGRGMWLVMSNGTQASPGNFSGTLYRTHGPPFSAAPFPSIAFPSNYTPVGSLALSFSDASTGAMTYTVNGVTQTKAIGRYVYSEPPTVCR